MPKAYDKIFFDRKDCHHPLIKNGEEGYFVMVVGVTHPHQKVPEPLYLHADGLWRDTAYSDDDQPTGWYEIEPDAQDVLSQYLKKN